MLTFIIPVRHHESVAGWSEVVERMALTFQSLAAQDHPDWEAIVVANEGAALPPLPPKFQTVRVDLPFKALPSPSEEKEAFYNAIRDDKGARIWAGFQKVQSVGHVMVVDYDDLVSCRLARLAASNPVANGWVVEHGYKYDGSKIVEKCPRFNDVCGTSLIVRHDLLLPPGQQPITPDHVRYMVGSHKFLRRELAKRGTPLSPLPFHGAMYRVGHMQSSEGYSSAIPKLRFRAAIREPITALRTFLRIRPLTAKLREEFLSNCPPDAVAG